MRQSKVNHTLWILRGVVLMLPAFGYLLSLAPTISLWDSGEFATVIHRLGIPHPPGAPLYLILGRFWELLLGFISQPALKSNLLSAFCSSLSCLLLFEIALHLGRRVSLHPRMTLPIALFAGLLPAFSDSFWNSAVETEVYALSILFLLLQVWIFCRWETGGAFPSRWLLLLVYIALLGAGVHLYSMLWFPCLWIGVGWRIRTAAARGPKKGKWPPPFFWFAGLTFCSVAVSFTLFLGLLLVGVLLLLLARFLNRFSFKLPAATHQAPFFLRMFILAALAYSSFLYLPLRSSLNPVIDEGDPETFTTLSQYIHRKQYTRENMLLRMFHRRGQWSSQFGNDSRIGFLGFQLTQFWPFPERGRPLFYFSLTASLVLLFFPLWYLWEALPRHRFWAAFLLSIYAVSSAGLVAYMNFADGTRIDPAYAAHWRGQMEAMGEKLQAREIDPGPVPDPNRLREYRRLSREAPADLKGFWRGPERRSGERWDRWKEATRKAGLTLPALPHPEHREVRKRDYFFLPAFIWFPLLLGLALGLLLTKGIRWRPGWERPLVAGVWVLASTVWMLPYFSHWKTHDRSRDYFAADFAFNLLSSCPPKALLFTHGDNDTFPLWYLQFVEGYRRDVTLINLSLANMDWYPRQLIRQDTSLNLPTIRQKGAYRAPQLLKPSRPLFIPLPADSTIGFFFEDTAGTLIRKQDRLVMEAVQSNYPERPVCFTLSTPKEASLGLEHHLETRGLVQVLGKPRRLNLEALDRHLFEVYRFRHVRKQMIHQDAVNLSQNYRKLLFLGTEAHRERAANASTPQIAEMEMQWIKKYENLALELFSP